MEDIIKIENLNTSFYTHAGEVKAVRGVDLVISKGEVLGIVGESGSGKSVMAKSVMGLIDYPGKIHEGRIIYKGMDLAELSNKEMRRIRGKEISMIFQDPMTSLNPAFTIGRQIQETIMAHERISKDNARKRAIELLSKVKIPMAQKRYDSYPHEFSGGMRQRVMIAMALCLSPSLIIADEPTTALDVTVQDQILKLMSSLIEEYNTSIMLITHDLGVVAQVCSRVAVMYGGMIMEEGSREDIFYNPKHPYTIALLNSVPSIDIEKGKRLSSIPGSPPDLLNPPNGCPFAPRCPYAMKICNVMMPEYSYIKEAHRSLCWLLDRRAPGHDDFLRGELNG